MYSPQIEKERNLFRAEGASLRLELTQRDAAILKVRIIMLPKVKSTFRAYAPFLFLNKTKYTVEKRGGCI